MSAFKIHILPPFPGLSLVSTYKYTWCHIPQDHFLNTQNCEKPLSNTHVMGCGGHLTTDTIT